MKLVPKCNSTLVNLHMMFGCQKTPKKKMTTFDWLAIMFGYTLIIIDR